MRIFLFGSQSEPLDFIEVLDHEKSSFRPSKWPQKFKTEKLLKIVNCLKIVFIQLE
jgi:hypothetical protein